MKILIAYDGSSCADRALKDLRHAGLPNRAEAIVVTVGEQWLPHPAPATHEKVDGLKTLVPPEDTFEQPTPASEAARDLAFEACKTVLSLFPEWEVGSEVYRGSPATELLAKADEWGADLVVVGSHGRSALGRFILGSVSQKVVTEAHCSVRIARGSEDQTDSGQRIMVAVDGSPCSMAAVQAVTERAWGPGADAYVVTVYDLITPTAVGQFIPPVVSMVQEGNEGLRKRAQAIAEKAAEELRQSGLATSTIVGAGDPKHVLLEEAQSLAVDSIFVGARGLTRVDRFLLGSVSAAIAARAHCSVEVVRPRSLGRGSSSS